MAHVNNEILRRAILVVEEPQGGEMVGDALRRMPGVAAVTAGMDEGRLEVRYDPALTSPGQFLHVALEAGFSARLQR